MKPGGSKIGSGKAVASTRAALGARRDEYAAFNRVYDRSMLSAENVYNLLHHTLSTRTAIGDADPSNLIDICAIGEDPRVGRFLRDKIVDFIGKDSPNLSLALCRGTPNEATGEIRGVSHWTSLNLKKVVGADGKTHIQFSYADSIGSVVPAAVSRVIEVVKGINPANYLRILADSPDVAVADSTRRAIPRMANVVLDDPVVVRCERQSDGYSCGYHATYNAVSMYLSSAADLSRDGSVAKLVKYDAASGATSELTRKDFIADSKQHLVDKFGGSITGVPRIGKGGSGGKGGGTASDSDADIELVKIISGEDTYLEKIRKIQAIERGLVSDPILLSSLSIENYYGVILNEAAQSLRYDLYNGSTAAESKTAEEFFELLVSPNAKNNIDIAADFLERSQKNVILISNKIFVGELKRRLGAEQVTQAELRDSFGSLFSSGDFIVNSLRDGSQAVGIHDDSARKDYAICKKSFDDGKEEYSIQEYDRSAKKWNILKLSDSDFAVKFTSIRKAISKIKLQALQSEIIFNAYNEFSDFEEKTESAELSYKEVTLNHGKQYRLYHDKTNNRFYICEQKSERGAWERISSEENLGQVLVDLYSVIEERKKHSAPSLHSYPADASPPGPTAPTPAPADSSSHSSPADSGPSRPEAPSPADSPTVVVVSGVVSLESLYTRLCVLFPKKEKIDLVSGVRFFDVEVGNKTYAISKNSGDDYYFIMRKDGDDYIEITNPHLSKEALEVINTRVTAIEKIASDTVLDGARDLYKKLKSISSQKERTVRGTTITLFELKIEDAEYALTKDGEQCFIMKKDAAGDYVEIGDATKAKEALSLIALEVENLKSPKQEIDPVVKSTIQIFYDNVVLDGKKEIEVSVAHAKYIITKDHDEYLVLKAREEGSKEMEIVRDSADLARDIDLIRGNYAISKALKILNEKTSGHRSKGVPELSLNDAAKFILLARKHDGIGNPKKDVDSFDSSVSTLFDDVNVSLYRRLASAFSREFQGVCGKIGIESKEADVALRLSDVDEEFVKIILGEDSEKYIRSIGLGDAPATSVSARSRATKLLNAKAPSPSL